MLELGTYESWLRNDCGFTDETIKKYISNLQLIVSRLQIKSIKDLTPAEINDRWFDFMWRQLQINRNLQNSTRIGYLSALKKYFQFLHHYGYITEDISRKIVLPKGPFLHLEGFNKEEKTLLREYLSTHLKTDKQRRDAALIYFLWGTAVRISEALNIRCHADGIILTDNPTVMSGDFTVSDGYFYCHINGKGKRNRFVAVPSIAIRYLNFYLSNREFKNEIVFVSHSRRVFDKKLTRNGAQQEIVRIMNNLGIKKKDMATHIFRHTAIDYWISLGVSPKFIINQTGHSSEVGLEPYYRRRKELTNVFALEANSLNEIKINKDLQKFEDLLGDRYARTSFLIGSV